MTGNELEFFAGTAVKRSVSSFEPSGSGAVFFLDFFPSVVVHYLMLSSSDWRWGLVDGGKDSHEHRRGGTFRTRTHSKGVGHFGSKKKTYERFMVGTLKHALFDGTLGSV